MSFRNNSKPSHDVGPQADRPIAPSEDGLLYASELGISVWDAIAGAWRTSVSGGSGGTSALIYTDGPLTSTNRFNSWQALYAVWQTMVGPKVLYIECTHGVPLHIPFAGMPFGGWVIGQEGKISGVQVGAYCELVIDQHVTLVDLVALGGTCGLININDDGGVLLYTPILPTGRPIILWLSEGATIRNDALAAPMFTWGEDNNTTGFFLVALTLASYLSTGLHHAPIFFVQPSGAFRSQMILAGITPQPGLPTISQDVIGGANPILGSTAVLAIIPTIGFVDLRQAAWNGDPLVKNFITSSTVIRPNNLSGQPPVPSGATYNVTNGSELVLCAPTGVGAIAIVLPPASLFPLEVVLVKKITSDAIDAINVTASDGGKVDGVLSVALPVSQFSYQRFVSADDGTGTSTFQWWSC